MRKAGMILALMVFCSALLPAESAKSFFKKGVQAEARQDYEAAYTYYRQAYQMEPTNLRYRVPYQRTRFMASASMVHRAQKLRDEGKLQDALQLFEQAASIDPSNQLAGQEVMATQQMIEKKSGAAPGAPPKEEEDPLRKRLEDALPPVRLKQIANVPIDQLEMTSDTKTIYETIGKIAGINVLFDPDFTPRNNVAIKLHNVTLQEALEIVALESRTFWRPVTPNTIFVAADTQAKRRELEQNAIKTFYLGNVSGPTDLQDIVNTIRTVLEVQRLQQIPSQNAIVMKATPDQLALAEKMIEDIDKGKPEVVVDVVVAQVRRDTTRNLGIIPPQNASVALQGTNVTTTPPGTTPGTTTTTPGTGGLNFNNLQHLNSTNYAVTIAPVTAQALLNDTDTKILQSPQLRATNGEKAKLTIADKIPIATGSFGTPVGVGTAVGAVGVNTQFTYTDVGVILEITPTIHPDGQVTLKESLNISNLNGSSTIGGITQPIISQRAVENIVRLNDGEINMLGGIYENDYTKSISGWPFLGQIPILKYIFAQENKEVTTNEIVFLLMPHIVRAQMLTDMNRRSFDVGTGSGIDLHLASRGPEGGVLQPASLNVAPASAPPATPAPNALLAGVKSAAVPTAGAAASPVPATTPASGPTAAIASAAPAGTASQSAPAPPGPSAPAAPAGAANPAGNQLSLSFDPGNVSPAQGSTFSLNVVLAHGQDVASVPIQIVYDPKVLEFVGVTNGDYLTKDGQTVALVKRDDAASGRLLVSAQRPPGSTGISGDGVVFNLTFKAKAKGSGVVSIAVAGARNSQNQPVAGVGSQAAVEVN